MLYHILFQVLRSRSAGLSVVITTLLFIELLLILKLIGLYISEVKYQLVLQNKIYYNMQRNGGIGMMRLGGGCCSG